MGIFDNLSKIANNLRVRNNVSWRKYITGMNPDPITEMLPCLTIDSKSLRKFPALKKYIKDQGTNLPEVRFIINPISGLLVEPFLEVKHIRAFNELAQMLPKSTITTLAIDPTLCNLFPRNSSLEKKEELGKLLKSRKFSLADKNLQSVIGLENLPPEYLYEFDIKSYVKSKGLKINDDNAIEVYSAVINYKKELITLYMNRGLGSKLVIEGSYDFHKINLDWFHALKVTDLTVDAKEIDAERLLALVKNHPTLKNVAVVNDGNVSRCRVSWPTDMIFATLFGENTKLQNFNIDTSGLTAEKAALLRNVMEKHNIKNSSIADLVAAGDVDKINHILFKSIRFYSDSAVIEMKSSGFALTADPQYLRDIDLSSLRLNSVTLNCYNEPRPTNWTDKEFAFGLEKVLAECPFIQKLIINCKSGSPIYEHIDKLIQALRVFPNLNEFTMKGKISWNARLIVEFIAMVSSHSSLKKIDIDLSNMPVKKQELIRDILAERGIKCPAFKEKSRDDLEIAHCGIALKPKESTSPAEQAVYEVGRKTESLPKKKDRSDDDFMATTMPIVMMGVASNSHSHRDDVTSHVSSPSVSSDHSTEHSHDY